MSICVAIVTDLFILGGVYLVTVVYLVMHYDGLPAIETPMHRALNAETLWSFRLFSPAQSW